MQKNKHRVFNIALPISIDSMFSYIIENCSTNESYIGRRVLVPFSNRLLTGVIVSENMNSDFNYKLKSVVEILDENPVFSPNMLKFLQWMGDYYIASLGEVIKAALPPAVAPKSVKRIAFLRLPTPIILNEIIRKSPRRGAILKYLSKTKTSVTSTYLQKKLGFSITNIQLKTLQDEGYISLKETMKQTKGKFLKAVKLNKVFLDEDKISAYVASIENKAPQQVKIINKIWVNKENTNTFKELQTELLLPTTSAIKSLIKKGILDEVLILDDRSKYDSSESLASKNEIKLNLSNEQKYCVSELEKSVNLGEYATYLLKGVTGSGKTLVYMHIIKQIIDKDGGVIFLVPEISLTPQLIDRFEKTFPGQIAQLHSRLSDGERNDNWQKIISGDKKIIIGARSAIFAPVKNLKLIIVDEEHDSSYKQYSPTPRYNARDAAIVRASFEKIVCVLGSATPSLETMYNAKTGKYGLLEINNRADGATMPEVKIIDMLDAHKNEQVIGSFSKDLLDAIVRRVKLKEGVILFLNRRGYAPILECTNCGYIPECKHCSVTLTYHKKINQLRCHYCGYTEYAKNICPKCKTGEMNVRGVGTQRAEEELNQYLKEIGLNAVIDRIDLDTTAKKGAFRTILKKFSEGNTDILLGTQMIAKGLDFSRCTLVGVINADTQLFISDFRSSERTFQLLTQVSGRAGRSEDKKGEVIIQSTHPMNPAINFALNANYNNYYEFEIDAREQSLYPPFVRFCVIEFNGKNENQLYESALYFQKALDKEKSINIYDPVKPVLEKIKGNNRLLLVIKSDKKLDKSGAKLRNTIKNTMNYYNKYFNSDVKVKIDIDSYSTV